MATPPAPASELDRLWATLRAATPARIGLARAGAAISTRETLAFQVAHARARDAVEASFDADGLEAAIAARGLRPLRLKSRAGDLAAYLARPDLGRALDGASRARLVATPKGFDLVFVLADGLSPQATAKHAPPLIDAALPTLVGDGWRVGPVAIVERGRVASRRRDRRRARGDAGRGADRRAAGSHRARQPRRLSDLGAAPRLQRRRAQLPLQHPPRRPALRRSGATPRGLVPRRSAIEVDRGRAQGRVAGCARRPGLNCADSSVGIGANLTAERLSGRRRGRSSHGTERAATAAARSATSFCSGGGFTPTNISAGTASAASALASSTIAAPMPSIA